ncbi:ParB/RepB/Spo0J family partition protein [Streptomyces sp. YS415]|uniref:ParB/RepB/Spo0J family partition protein n=1 Tax=Streptomyces sp. YS415 TaxID=2944806 RepID=UPI0020205F9C|nr:ParB/RepB/Spo0J family partition protein [Streptomyces sp. YS415]MCL7429787.1 ParB/RepB/Spo0J family partition protein [Streptomyces sp. YS415]
MSKADQLGTGRFSGGVRPVSARRQAMAAATGVPTEGVAPPTELPPHRISLNPDNPRSKLGDLTDLSGSLRTHGQKQAITVMNRDAYLQANPERAPDLEPDTTHVVIDGSSRLAAAREAQLATIKVMVSDDQGSTSEELLESALVANIHRQDLEELDEARALERLLAIHGSQSALAKRLHRSQGWVSQRLALLNLTPELQARIGEEPIKLLRAVGNKPHAEQEEALRQLKEELARKEEPKQKRGPKKADSDATRAAKQSTEGDSYYSVIEGGPAGTPEADGIPDGERSADRATKQAVPEPRGGQQHVDSNESVAATTGETTAAGGPDQATSTGTSHSDDQRQPKRFPYTDGAEAAHYLILKMPPDEFNKMLDLLIKHRSGHPASAG